MHISVICHFEMEIIRGVGDYFFKRTPRGRLLVSTVAVMLGAILLFLTPTSPWKALASLC